MMNDYTFYIVAGIATSPNFFTNLIDELKIYYSESSKKIDIHTIYPYGDWTNRVTTQLNKVLTNYIRADRSYGALEIRRYILEHHDSGKIIILGHSAGGVAGYHAVQLLEKLDGRHVHRMVQIGSAKVRISREYLEKVAYIRASSGDFITRLGSWGGMSKSVYHTPYWDPYKYAPVYRWDLDLVGGHPDYFRNQKPFIDQDGVSNLSKTLNIILHWLAQLSALTSEK